MFDWILKKSGTFIAETTVQHIKRYDMLDTVTAARVEIFNIAINEQLDDTDFWIQHGEGRFTSDYDYNLQQWDPDYRVNETTAEK